MAFLTHLVGPFPIGIWAVLAMLLVSGGVLPACQHPAIRDIRRGGQGRS